MGAMTVTKSCSWKKGDDLPYVGRCNDGESTIGTSLDSISNLDTKVVIIVPGWCMAMSLSV